MLMRLIATAISIALLVAGCVGGAIRPESDALAGLANVYLVPMESPPLDIPQSYASASGGTGSLVYYLPRYTVGMARAAGMVSGIFVLIDMAAASHARVDYADTIEPSAVWTPSIVLANEARQLLDERDMKSAVSSKIQPIPGIQDRERTITMENWLAPIRAWYNNDSPPRRYAALSKTGSDAVIEIGISNYEIHANKLLLQVHMKLIATSTGQLLGRSRASSFTDLPPIEQLFSNDAKAFKDAIAVAGQPLVASCLKDLGFSSR